MVCGRRFLEMLKKVRSGTRGSAAVVVCRAYANSRPFRPGFEVVFALQVMVHLSNPFDVLSSMAALLQPPGALWVDLTSRHKMAARVSTSS